MAKDGDSAMTSGRQPATPVDVVLPLPDLLDQFVPPHRGRIVSGLDVLTRPECGLSPLTVYTFHRRLRHTPGIRLTWDNPQTTVDVGPELDARFRVLPYDPSTGDTSQQLRYRSVADLAAVFPPFVVVRSIQQQTAAESSTEVRPGDRLKLLRIVYRNGESCVECRRRDETRVLCLPFSLVGDFVAVFDPDVDYTLLDLISQFPARRRRVELCAGQNVSIPGLPAFNQEEFVPPGNLFVEALEWDPLIEACPVDDPTTVIRLPASDSRILVAPDDLLVRRGHSLGSFVANSRGMFPLLVRLVDWQEETSVLENHFVRPGVELVLHGPTKQAKVIARVGADRFFSVPSTYRGLFRRRPRVFAGARQLSSDVREGCSCLVRVVYIDLSEQLPIGLGDTLRVKNDGRSTRKTNIRCERIEMNGTMKAKTKEVKIPLTSNASFEEILINNHHHHNNNNNSEEGSASGGGLLNVEQLASIVSSAATEVRVQLVTPSVDTPRSRHDLPTDVDIFLTSVIIEPAVYASVDAADRPAFQLPLRTPIHVRFLAQLDRSESPLLMASSRSPIRPRLSMLDRCAELLSTGAMIHIGELPAVRRVLQDDELPSRLTAISDGSTAVNLSDSTVTPKVAETTSKQKEIQLTNRRYRSVENLYQSAAAAEVSMNTNSTLDRKKPATRTINGAIVLDSGPAHRDVTTRTDRKMSLPAVQSSSVAPLASRSLSSTDSAAVTSQTGTMTSLPPGYGLVPLDMPTSPNVAKGYLLVPLSPSGDLQQSSSPSPWSPSGNDQKNGNKKKQVTFNNNNNNNNDDDDADDDDDDDVLLSQTLDSNFPAKAGKFKLRIPDDGNLYNLPAKRFTELLESLRLDEPVIQACKKRRMDGKQFSRLSENEMDLSGLMHPVLVHFRRLTAKKQSSSSSRSLVKISSTATADSNKHR